MLHVRTMLTLPAGYMIVSPSSDMGKGLLFFYKDSEKSADAIINTDMYNFDKGLRIESSVSFEEDSKSVDYGTTLICILQLESITI